MITEEFLAKLSKLKIDKANAKYQFHKKDLLRKTFLAQITSQEKFTCKTMKEAENNALMSQEYVNYIEELLKFQLDYDLLNAEVQGMELAIQTERDKRIDKATDLKHQNLTQI